MFFGDFNSQNENNSTWGTKVVKSIFLVHFLGELKIPKRHFEINWPLNTVHVIQLDCIIHCLYMTCMWYLFSTSHTHVIVLSSVSELPTLSHNRLRISVRFSLLSLVYVLSSLEQSVLFFQGGFVNFFCFFQCVVSQSQETFLKWV